MSYDPTQLPEIDEVHVLVLGYKLSKADEPLPTTTAILDVGWHFPIHSVISVIDKDAVQLIAQTWRSLPLGERDRCHNPPYGLRFFQLGQKILETSLCWECNNIFIRIGDKTTGYDFASASDIAQRLLKLAHYLSGRYLEQPDAKITSLKDLL